MKIICCSHIPNFSLLIDGWLQQPSTKNPTRATTACYNFLSFLFIITTYVSTLCTHTHISHASSFTNLPRYNYVTPSTILLLVDILCTIVYICLHRSIIYSNHLQKKIDIHKLKKYFLMSMPSLLNKSLSQPEWMTTKICGHNNYEIKHDRKKTSVERNRRKSFVCIP